MISFKSSFVNINVVIPNPIIFFGIAASVAEAGLVNPKGTRTLLTKGFSLMVKQLSLRV